MKAIILKPKIQKLQKRFPEIYVGDGNCYHGDRLFPLRYGLAINKFYRGIKNIKIITSTGRKVYSYNNY